MYKRRNRKNYRRNFRKSHKKGFNPTHLISQSGDNPKYEEQEYIPEHSFDDFSINPIIKQNLKHQEITTPTQIQDQAIPVLLQDKDVVGIANTGTGKTAAFLIPLINKLLDNQDQKALIIVPTRELAIQIDRELNRFSRRTRLCSVICIGGVGMYPQIKKLSRKHQVVIGTPGRLLDLSNRKKIYLSDYQNLVLDEVDRMLDMGFVHDVKKLVYSMPNQRHSSCFSATSTPRVNNIINDILSNPTVFTIQNVQKLNIDQKVINTRGKSKIDTLHDILISNRNNKILVFGRTKRGLDKLAGDLGKRGFNVAAIHGNKRQNQREKSLTKFRKNIVNILLATDVASRGLDIQGVTHVINYDLPQTKSDYTHRIGRTGRGNNAGVALTFID